MVSHHEIERLRELVRNQGSLIPLGDAQFLWEVTLAEPEAAHSFLVVPKGLPGSIVHDFQCSTGSDSEGWPDAIYNNPELVFGEVLAFRWISEQERARAIGEFAKIDGLPWAQRMLAGMLYSVGGFSDSDDPNAFGPWQSVEAVDLAIEELLEKIAERDRRTG